MRILSVLLPLLLIMACGEEEEPVTTPENSVGFLFTDGFETASDDLNELFPGDDSRWTNVQLVSPHGAENEISLATTPVAEGSQALRIYARATDGTLSKADIERSGFTAPAGSTVRITANFYVTGDADLTDLFLLDLECCGCWDPAVPDNQCPGVRLVVKENDFMAIERGKILNETLRQTSVPFPRDEWFELVWQLTLSAGEGGENRLLINGEEAIATSGANLPEADAFAAAFAAEGIDFTLQQPVTYERFQIGATANPTATDVELFVDAVRFEIIE